MKLHRSLFFILVFLVLAVGCKKKDEFNPNFRDKGQKMYLYGEYHSVKKILDEELKYLEKHYVEGVRDVFIESPYATGEFLNIWMKADDDKILDELLSDEEYSYFGDENNKEFLKIIKKKFPDVVFHGTDIEHTQTSFRYLMYLHNNNIKDDYSKSFVEENIKQRREFYKAEGSDWKYREEKMIENFKKQYEKLGNKPIVGFYGMAHLDESKEGYHRERTGIIMVDSLKELYKDVIVIKDLTNIDLSIRTEEVEVFGKKYKGKYYEWTNRKTDDSKNITQVWELENAYEDFKNFETKEEFYSKEMEIVNLKENTVYKIKYVENEIEHLKIFVTENKNKDTGNVTIRELKID